MRHIVILVLIALVSACATTPQKASLPSSETFVQSGFNQLSERNYKQAVADAEKAIALCEGQYSNTEQRVYASRGMAETIYYMVKAQVDDLNSIAVGPTCADALFLKGFASLDMGQIEVAEEYVKKAIDMAPVNSMYLSELGHIYQSKHDWENALKLFNQAESAAKTFSPPELKTKELARAKRGVGFSLIELGKLDEAQAKFEECLEIDKNDQRAIDELKYIESIRNKPVA